MTSNEQPRVLVIGLDGVDIGFAERLMAKGELPALQALRDRSARFLLDHGAAARTGLAWEHFASGMNPETARRSSLVMVDPSTYDVWQEGTRFEPFVARLNAHSVVFDAPYADLTRAPGVDGVVAWGAHDPGVEATAHPNDLLKDLPDYPASEWIYAVPWSSVDRTKAMGIALVEGLDARSSVASWLLDERLDDWDLAVVVAGEPHSAAEAFWHGVDHAHPLYRHPSAPFALEALENVYKAVDRLVAKLVDQFDTSQVIAFSMGGMGPNESDVASMVLLPELIFRWATHEKLLEVPPEWSNNPDAVPMLPDDVSWDGASPSWYPAPPAPVALTRTVAHRLPTPIKRWLRNILGGSRQGALPAKALSLDWQPAARYRKRWPEMAAFALPSLYDGRIRVNLRGRESEGIVDPADYDIVLDELESLIRACKDPRTGASVVATVGRHDGVDPNSLQGTDADLTVIWSGAACTFEHPDHGLIGPVPYRRTGGHTGPYGFAYVAGSDIQVGDRGIRSAFDVAPTVVELVGNSPLEGMSGTSMLGDSAPVLREL